MKKSKSKIAKKPSAPKSPTKRKIASKITKPAIKRKVASKSKGILTPKTRHQIEAALAQLEAILNKLESKAIKKFS